MKFRLRPTVDHLEGRQLLSFGGGNIDPTIPRFPSGAPGLNLTSNTFHSINDQIGRIAADGVATPSELDSLVQRLPRGVNRLLPILTADVNTFTRGTNSITTAEANAVLNNLFNDLLDRDADPVALSLGVQAIRNGATVPQIVNFIVTSPEYIGNNITDGASPNENQVQLVTALYNDVLGHEPPDFGLDFWVTQLNTGAFSPQGVASAFTFSAEAATSETSILQRDALPVTSPSYYFGLPTPTGSITGNFSGTNASLKNLLQRDILTYLETGIGTSFNVLKSRINFASDRLLTYNGRV